MAGLSTPMALRVAVTLGLPDRLAEEATAEEVAAERGLSPVPLRLLLNHLATLGIVARADCGYRTTELGAAARRGQRPGQPPAPGPGRWARRAGVRRAAAQRHHR